MSREELSFTVDSLLISELGERLVTKNHVALAELIKNAYDADANSVEIIFTNPRQNENSPSKITIIDDGHGMTYEAIKDFWMVIATSNKIRSPHSPKYGRRKTGDKGIGRFSCSRLAETLVLETWAKNVKTGNNEHSTVTFNWADYLPGLKLSEIPNIAETTIDNTNKTGTSLHLIGLRTSWTQRDYNVLRRQIVDLSIVGEIHREGFEKDIGLEILLNAPDFEGGIGSLSDQIMDSGWGRLVIDVDSDGVANLKLDALKIGQKTHKLRDYEELKNIKIDISIIYRNKQYLRDSTTLATYVIDDIFQNYSGVRVFLNGFRVYPYGEVGNDWLNIDLDVTKRVRPTSDTFKKIAQNLKPIHERATLLLYHLSHMGLLFLSF